jgi:pilus assembly protein Flp/PilA
MKTIIRLIKDESGATAIEYGLIAALISLAIIVAAGAIGTNLDTTFSAIASNLT